MLAAEHMPYPGYRDSLVTHKRPIYRPDKDIQKSIDIFRRPQFVYVPYGSRAMSVGDTMAPAQANRLLYTPRLRIHSVLRY